MVKALGVYFSYEKGEAERHNWHEKLLRWWNRRDLSLKGRILIVKTLALAKVVYLTAAIYTPVWVTNTIKKDLFGFIWHFKREKNC